MLIELAEDTCAIAVQNPHARLHRVALAFHLLQYARTKFNKNSLHCSAAMRQCKAFVYVTLRSVIQAEVGTTQLLICKNALLCM